MALERFIKGEVLTATKMNALVDEIEAKATKESVEENELVVATALNEQKKLKNEVENNELVIATALQELRKETDKNATLTTFFYKGTLYIDGDNAVVSNNKIIFKNAKISNNKIVL